MPGQTEGETSDRNAWLTDVLPTIADAIDVEVPWETDGSSLLAAETRAGDDDKPLLDWSPSSVHPEEGDYLRLDAEAGFEEVLGYGFGGDPDDPSRLYRWGEHGDLVGRRVDDLTVGEPASFDVALESPEDFDDVVRDETLPVYVHAVAEELNEDTRGAFAAAFAVNGVIAGWGNNITPFAVDPLGVHALVSPEFTSDGDNDVRIYLIEERDGGIVLHPFE
jgi:hypothetical protein